MGEVTATKRGKYWQYKFEAAKVDNKQRRLFKSGFRTNAEALAAGVKAMAEYNEAGLHFTTSEIRFMIFSIFGWKRIAVSIPKK